MKLLFIITSLDTGGAEISLLRLITGLRDNSLFDIELLCLTQPKDDLYKEFQKICEVKIFDLNYNTVSNLLKLTNYVRKFRPDIIHSHMVHSNFIGAFLKVFIVKTKLICTAHSTNEGKFSFLYPLISYVADFCTHVSRIALESYLKKSYFDKKKSSYLPNPVPRSALTPPVQPSSSDIEFKFFCIGRLVTLKNYDIVIKAAHLMSKGQSNFSITIIGYGPDELKLKRLARDLGISGKVSFLGFREDVNELIINMDCLIIMSSYEGLPTVLLESLQHGKMFITTDVGDCGLIAKECSGSVVLNDLSVAKLSIAMRMAIDEFKDKKEDISLVNKQYFAHNFEAEVVVRSFLSLYKKVMA